MSDQTGLRALVDHHKRAAVRILGQMSCGDDNDTRRTIRKEAQAHTDVADALTDEIDRLDRAALKYEDDDE